MADIRTISTNRFQKGSVRHLVSALGLLFLSSVPEAGCCHLGRKYYLDCRTLSIQSVAECPMSSFYCVIEQQSSVSIVRDGLKTNGR